MACCSPDKPSADKNPRPEAVDACFGGPCRPTPNYVGKVAYIMGPGDYAGGNNSGLFFIVAQDGESRIDAVPLKIGYGGHDIKRFNLQRKVETLDGKTKITEPASITQVREDNEFATDWARKQYQWGQERKPDADGKLRWVSSVYEDAVSMAELVVLTLERIVAERGRIVLELQRDYQRMLDRAVKDAMYRRAYGG